MKIGCLVLGALLVAHLGMVRGAVVVDPNLHAQSAGGFDFDGVRYEQSQVLEGPTRLSTAALVGLRDTPEVRTAGRVGGDEIAVNARADGKEIFRQTEIPLARSAVTYGAKISLLSGPAQHVFARFHMPAGYVENMNNAELRLAEITSGAQAFIASRTCAAVSVCTPTDELFFFQALLESASISERHYTLAHGQAGLDLSPLLDPTFTDSGPGFLRTRNLAFPEFDGVLDLGTLSAGQWIEFDYSMFARSEGLFGFSYGIAAINDPFFFDTDPVRRHPTVSFFSVDVVPGVGEPGSLALLLAVAAVTLMRHQPGRPTATKCTTHSCAGSTPIKADASSS